uniref:WRKY transcription factor n=1 Tax=Tamarix androssowii TaxID=189785 RepID=H9BP00_9CARY|nr:WRKY transcription factor [Tamarix androssowii]
MEIKEVVERVAVAKPVASKPSSFSTFKSFSELLAGAINAASPSLSHLPVNASSSETAVPAPIKPKTVRVKPTLNHAPPFPAAAATATTSTSPFSQAENSEAAACMPFDDKISKVESNTNNVLYKPLAKVVSQATISLLANMGNSNISHQQALSQVKSRSLHSNQHNLRSQPITNPRPSINPSPTVTSTRPVESPKTAAPQIMEEDPKAPPFASTVANVDRPSYDGYNWRKYGQKQVKGSEYPRSYYKCTHSNCQVKKKVERSFDGQIAEIVYKGEHNHPKPQPPKRSPSSLGLQGPSGDGVVDGQGQDNNSNVKRYNNKLISEVYDDCERREVGLSNQSSHPSKTPGLPYDPAGTTPDNSCGRSLDGEEGSKGRMEMMMSQAAREGTSQDCTQEPRVLVQSTTEAEILEDGFRWRKYGQKVVKGNPYPRSYYRCTSHKCTVRKHIERVSDDPSSFITTYEGKHNHEMPAKITSLVASEPDPEAPNKDSQ